jgi:hypothetical protein
VRDPEGALQGCVKGEGEKIFGGHGDKERGIKEKRKEKGMGTGKKQKKEPLAKAFFL